MKRSLVALFLLGLACAPRALAAGGKVDRNAPCRVTTGYFDDDKHADYVLENGLIKATFSSGKGGKCTSLIYKPAGAELVRAGDATQGALFELFWTQKSDKAAGRVAIGRINAAHFNYSSRISGRSDDDVRVEFAIAPKFEGLKGWRYKHSVILKRGSPTLQIQSHGSSLAAGDDIQAGVWFRNCFWVQKEFVDPHRVAMMVDNKLRVCTVPGDAPLDWPSQPVRYPYTGLYGTQSGVGVVMKIEAKSLGEASAQYSWCSPKHGGLITLEWMTQQNRCQGYWKTKTSRGPLWYWELTVFDRETYRSLPAGYHPICAALIDPKQAAAAKPAPAAKPPKRNDPFLFFSKAYKTRTVKDLLRAVPKLDERMFSLFPKNVSVRARPAQTWGTPLAGGPLRAVTVGGVSGVEIKDTYIPPFVRSKRGPLHPQVEERLSKALDGDWELVVLRSGAPWAKLSEEVRAKILTGVKAGRGLITTKRFAKGALAALVKKNRLTHDADLLGRLAALKTFRRVPTYAPGPEKDHYGQILTLAKVGQGRIAILNDTLAWSPSCYRPLNVTGEPFTWRLWAYDYALVGRVARWAARGWPSTSISSLKTSVLRDGNGLDIALNGRANAAAEVVIRDWDTRVEARRKASKVEAGKARVLLPNLKSGRHIAEVILRDSRGKALDWGAVVFTVPDGAATLALALDKSYYRRGDRIRATVSVRGKLPANGGTVRLNVMDSQERVFHRAGAKVAAGATAAGFDVPTADLPMYRAYFEATLDGKTATGVACESHVIVNILPPADRDFLMDAWGAGSTRGYGALSINRLGKKLGFTNLQTVRFVRRHEQFVTTCDAIMAANMRPSFYGASCNIADEKGASYPYPPLAPPGRGNACKVGPDRIRKPCLTSPEFWRLFERNLGDYAGEMTGMGVLRNVLQDEGALDKWGGIEEPRHELCLSRTCMAAFREFLKKEYPGLAALNKDWETNYAKWEEVIPATYADIMGKKNFAPWMLNRRFRDGIYAAAIERLGRTMEKFSPDLKTGMSGTGGLTPYTNRDYSQYVPAMRVIQRYSSPDIIRSFKKPGTVVSRWVGYDGWNTNELGHRFNAWNSFIQGEDGVSVYCFKSTLPGAYGLFWPGGHVRDVGMWLTDSSKHLSRGLTRVMLRGERQEDGIALVYSPRSIHVGYALRSLRWKAARGTSVGQVLTDLGFQYHILSSEEVAAGELARGKYRAVFTSASCMLDKEVEAIRAFVRNGGLLVSDTRPAFVSQTGRILDHGRLDDVFGVKAGEMSPVNKIVPIGKLKATEREEGIQSTSATVFLKDNDGRAVSFVKTYGKGRAVLLNFTVPDYSKTIIGGVAGETSTFVEGQKTQKRATRAIYRNILRQQRISPRMTVKEIGADESHLAGVEAAVYELGAGVSLAGLLKKPYTIGPAFRKKLRHAVTVSLPRKAHVYDTRRGKYLGETDTVKTAIDTAVGEVYALLPRKVTGLRVDLAERTADGQLVAGRIALEADRTVSPHHVFHVEVFDPTGEEEMLYRRNVDAPGGKASFRILLPLDAAPGKWRVIVREALTGIQVETSFLVAKAN